jgi:hypothetical protein
VCEVPRAGRASGPIFDSPSVKSAEKGGHHHIDPCSYDAGKKAVSGLKGSRARNSMSSSICTPLLMRRIFRIATVALSLIMHQLNFEIVKRSGTKRPSRCCPKHSIIQRTIDWLNRCRSLAKDWECLNRKAPAFLRMGLYTAHAATTLPTI